MSQLTNVGINDDGEVFFVFDDSKYVGGSICVGDYADEVMDELERLRVDVRHAVEDF